MVPDPVEKSAPRRDVAIVRWNFVAKYVLDSRLQNALVLTQAYSLWAGV
jgi:hypothetical protein